MKTRYLWIIIFWISSITNLFPVSDLEFLVKGEYSQFPSIFFNIDRYEKYNNGVWESYKYVQNEDNRKTNIFQISASLLFPVVDNWVYHGIEIGLGKSLKKNIKEYYIPALNSDLTMEIINPTSFFINMDYEQYISQETDIVFVTLSYKLKFRVRFSNKLNFNLAFGIGGDFIHNNIFENEQKLFVRDTYIYKEGDIVKKSLNRTNLYFLPFGHGDFSFDFKIGQKIYLGIFARGYYFFSSDFTSKETDLFQIGWWPDDEIISTLKSGYDYGGYSWSLGIQIKIAL